MKKYIPAIFPSLLLFVFFSCTEEAIYTPDERFVLQAFLYANEPVNEVTLKNAVPLTVSDSVGEPINNGEIVLYKNNIAYPLISNSDSGTYAYPGNDLQINSGDIFYIEAIANGKTATAETTVPQSPEGVYLSVSAIELPEIEISTSEGFGGFQGMRELMDSMRSVSLEVLWDNPNEELHFVVIENAETDQESILPDLGGNFNRAGRMGAFRRITEPTRESSYEINFAEITYWGKYVVKVYRVNQEYANLYENLEQDSRDLNEPPTNVKNALGIFSAFNSKQVYFEVVKK